jgi:hypothetical protein
MCPVRRECLASALEEEQGTGTRYGIRGGVPAHLRFKYRHMPAEDAVELLLKAGQAQAFRLGLLSEGEVA